MESKTCLNCNQLTGRNYCPNCGQKAGTHRITIAHFFRHDVLHGIWHLERGILFTIKETLARPGQAALDYISGKRVRYYNVFYLSLLVLAAIIVLNSIYGKLLDGTRESSGESSEFAAFLGRYIKFVLLGIVPLLAFNGWIIFRRMRLNLAEHMIIGGIALLGMLLWAIPFYFFLFAEQYFIDALSVVKVILMLVIVLFPGWVYHNAARKLYSFPGFSWRIVLFFTLTFLELVIVTAIILSVATSDSKLRISM